MTRLTNSRQIARRSGELFGVRLAEDLPTHTKLRGILLQVSGRDGRGERNTVLDWKPGQPLLELLKQETGSRPSLAKCAEIL